MRRWHVAVTAAVIGWLLMPPGVRAAEPQGSQAPAAIDPTDLATFVDGFVEARMSTQKVVGVTVSVVYRGARLFSRGYGYDDLAAQRPVDPARSLFRPGSISKTFTWTAVMQLVEQGKLDLDADVQQYLPNLEIADTFPEPITLLDLMGHTPGYEDSAIGHLFGNDPAVLPLVDYLQHYVPARVRPPGTLPSYSNYGAAMAGLIVANISGMPWEDYAERYLFEPLDMRHSTFREPWSDTTRPPMPDDLRANVSKGYARHAGGYRAGAFTFISHLGPAGALSTTANDLGRWMLVHLNDGELDGARILGTDSARLMHRQHHTMDPQMPGMAHGFVESNIDGYRAIGHGGGTIYFLSDMEMVPDLGLGVFISTNTSGGGGQLIDGFVEALVARYFPPGPLFIAEPDGVEAGRPLSAYAGTYLSTRRPYTTVERMFNTTGVTIAPGEDAALVAATPIGEMRLVPLGGDDFRSDRGQRVKFTSGPDGAVNALLLSIPIMVMEKVGPLGDPRALYGLLAAAALIMACALVGAWLRRGRGMPQSTVEAWAARLVLITALAWLAVYVLGALGTERLANDVAAVFFDFPSRLFVAALALALPAALLTVLSVCCWCRSGAPRAGRCGGACDTPAWCWRRS